MLDDMYNRVDEVDVFAIAMFWDGDDFPLKLFNTTHGVNPLNLKRDYSLIFKSQKLYVYEIAMFHDLKEQAWKYIDKKVFKFLKKGFSTHKSWVPRTINEIHMNKEKIFKGANKERLRAERSRGSLNKLIFIAYNRAMNKLITKWENALHPQYYRERFGIIRTSTIPDIGYTFMLFDGKLKDCGGDDTEFPYTISGDAIHTSHHTIPFTNIHYFTIR